ncbi:MAG: hypothetical protein EHM20_07510 [Alphaproteobacteria bacterium]|nr:MAG: hypothetical protein EHM20_07510 [Alphaproteobacteria bacterium]
MKTVKILFFASIILFASITKTFAKGNENVIMAYNKLNEQLKEIIGQAKAGEPSSFVVLTFSVNEKNEIENVQVESTNDELTNQVKALLVNRKVKVNPLFEGQKGQVSMQIENKV